MLLNKRTLEPPTYTTQTNKKIEEIKARVQAGSRCYFGLNKIFKSKLQSFFKNLKGQLNG